MTHAHETTPSTPTGAAAYRRAHDETAYPGAANAAPAPEKTYAGYAARLYLGGWFGLHKFYIGDTTAGLVYACTFGKATVGWLGDMFGARRKFNKEMAEQGVLSARTRG